MRIFLAVFVAITAFTTLIPFNSVILNVFVLFGQFVSKMKSDIKRQFSRQMSRQN